MIEMYDTVTEVIPEEPARKQRKQRERTPVDARTMKAVVRVAKKSIPTYTDKRLNENLEYFCGSLADAYKVGVEEAQGEILARLGALMVSGAK